MDVTVENNVLGARVDESADSFIPPVLIYYSRKVSFDGNTWPEWCEEPEQRIKIEGGGQELTGEDLFGYYE